jgi:voltage-gated potassium channel
LERITEWPLTLLAVVLTVILVAPHVTSVSATTLDVFSVVDNIIWGVFVADLVVKVSIAPDRLRYLRRHWFDIALVALPMFRSLKLLRSVRALRTLTIARALTLASRAVIGVGQILGRRGMQYVLLIAMIVVILAGALVTAAERSHQEATIHSFADGLWWAVTTVTTVGYGDTYPKTAAGRGIGVALMLLGITLFGVVTAHLAAIFVEDQEDAVEARLIELTKKIGDLEELIRHQGGEWLTGVSDAGHYPH